MTAQSQGSAKSITAGISRRQLVHVSAGALGALGAASLGIGRMPVAHADMSIGNPGTQFKSLVGAYSFLTQMMDAYQAGATLRLAQSYSDQNGLNSTAFIYDNTLQILAYL